MVTAPRRVAPGPAPLDLLRLAPLRRFIAWRGFQPLVQAPFVAAFLLLIYIGLFEYPSRGGLPVIVTWSLWWSGIVLLVLFFGKLWCTVCPWNAIADWLNRLGRIRRVPASDLLGAARPWPRWLRNLGLATTCFVILIWLELLPGLDMVVNPRATAVVALAMLALSVVSTLRYERSSFCRYGCLVGRVSGLYSLLAPLELRARDPGVCRSCPTRDCYHGNQRGYPCPTHEYLGTMDRNTYCILCMECVKSCPEDNVALRLRPFGADLLRLSRVRADEAVLAVILLSLTLFHILTMTPLWSALEIWLRGELRLHRMVAYTGLMGIVLLVPALLHLGGAAAARRLGARPRVTLRRAWLELAYPLLPLALFGHMAHNLAHLASESGYLLPALTDPFNRGADLLHLGSGYAPRALLGDVAIRALQLACLATGLGFATLASLGAARRLFAAGGRPRAALVPIFAGLVAWTLLQAWLLSLPMVSRIGLA